MKGHGHSFKTLMWPFMGYFILKGVDDMHMADALISPAVGGTMLAIATGVGAYSVKKVQNDMDESKIPLMGVMGAFVFAAQMINFSIPGTGSSGHLGGGMLLAILLGPYAGFLTMASILLIQALFFGDGGLLAYGCNVFNLGFYTCFIAYPFIYKRFVRKGINPKSILIGSMASSIVGLQLGAFSVVVETVLSGKTELPFGQFLAFMLPIHLAIGVVEGLATAAVVTFVWKERPEILERAAAGQPLKGVFITKVLTMFAVAALVVGGLLSWFASSNPDGLEWSLERVAGTAELEPTHSIHGILSEIQNKIALLPDYGFKTAENEAEGEGAVIESGNPWPVVDAGTSISGVVGGIVTLVLAAFLGWIVSISKKRKNKTGKVVAQ